MFGKKSVKPKEGDFRIAEKYIPESNDTVYEVQRYQDNRDWAYEFCYWSTKQVCSTMTAAQDWVNRYRKADDVKYHYCP